jgi:hypothetical protein
MKCSSCRTKLKRGTKFCNACGVENVEPPKSGDEAGSKRTNKKLFIFCSIGVISLIVSGIFFYLFAPKVVSIAIAIDAPYGGIFETGCNLSQNLNGDFSDTLTLVATNSEDSGTIEQRVKFVSKNGLCEAVGSVTVQPNTLYDLSLGSTLVGSLDGKDSNAGFLRQTAKVEIHRRLFISVTYKDKAAYCTGKVVNGPTGSDWTCYGLYHMDWGNSGSCHGIGIDKDIKAGADVITSGISNKIKVVSKLPGPPNVTLKSIRSAELDCQFNAFPVDIPNDDSGYEVRIAGGDPVRITNAELNGQNFISKQISIWPIAYSVDPSVD